jgi:hypothetical protein
VTWLTVAVVCAAIAVILAATAVVAQYLGGSDDEAVRSAGELEDPADFLFADGDEEALPEHIERHAEAGDPERRRRGAVERFLSVGRRSETTSAKAES